MANNIEKKLTSTKKIFLLITIIRKSKVDFYLDLLSGFYANLQWVCIGNGTTKSNIFKDEIGTKGIIFSVLTEDNAKKALATLKSKFDILKDGKGVAFMVPIDSVMGVTLFNFLSNNKDQF